MGSAESIAQLRERLQGPRRPHDTFYGRHVMRKLSIYLTGALSKTAIRPEAVTAFSIGAGALGALSLSKGQWFLGILLVNLWYLLDHVDGELARFREEVSVTGLYFDTITNAIVPPLTFWGLGVGLWEIGGSVTWLWMGVTGAYASWMLLAIPFCESAVLLQWLKEKKHAASARPAASNALGNALAVGILKKTFAKIHLFITFPVVLPVLTATILFSAIAPSAVSAEGSLKVILALYAVCATFTWTFILANQILTRKTDAKFAEFER